MSFTCDLVSGLQWGDEAKGKITHWLLTHFKYNWCVRFNGGPNAGHTIYVKGIKIATHQIPSGIFQPNIKCLIGPACVVDMKKLDDELSYIEDMNTKHDLGLGDIRSRVYLSSAAHVITPEAIAEDKKNDSIGTTHSGIGPTFAAKALRIGKRLGDMGDTKLLGCHLGDSFDFLHASSDAQTILLEGAQGFALDIDVGTYPYVTSGSCLTGSAFNVGLAPQSLRYVFGAAKIYQTYVGTMKFQPADDYRLNKIQEVGKEFGVTTGRPRQCNWLDLTLLKKSIIMNGVTHLVISKCDVLEKTRYFQLINLEGNSINFDKLESMQEYIVSSLNEDKIGIKLKIIFSSSPDMEADLVDQV